MFSSCAARSRSRSITKTPVLAPGAAIRRDDRFVGEDRREGTVIVRDHVGPEQGALAVDRHRQTIWIVSAGIVQKHVLDAEDAAVGGERDFSVVRLPTLVRGSKEMLEAVFDPLTGD